MEFKVRCPGCGKRVRASDKDAGGQALCPACGTRFEIPPAPLLSPLGRAPLSGAAPPPLPEPHDPGVPMGTPVEADPAEELVSLQLDRAVIVAAPPPPPAVIAAPAAGPDQRPVAPNGNGNPSGASPPVLLGPLNRPGGTLPDETNRGTGLVEMADAAASGAPARETVATKGGPDADVVRPRRSGHPLWWVMLGAAACAAVVYAFLVASGRFDTWERDHRAALLDLKARAEILVAGDQLTEALAAYQELEKVVEGRRLRDPHLREIVDGARADRQKVYALLIARKEQAARARAAAAEAARQAAADPGPALPPVPPLVSPSRGPTPGPVAVAPPRQGTGGDDAPPASKPPARAPKEPDNGRPPVVRVGHDRPKPQPAPVDEAGVITDERIGRSIGRGVDWLLDQFDPDTHLLRNRPSPDDAHYAGLNALAIYALLQCGQATNDPRVSLSRLTMKAKLDALKALPIDGHHQTYARALRATCLALYNRQADFDTLRDDADYLLGTANDGAYTYKAQRVPVGRRTFTGADRGWDNSNSQYGLLGVWSAADADPRVEVPLAYWRSVDKHWTEHQLPDGQWGYTRGGGKITMTAAGLASLFVTHEYLEPYASTARGDGWETVGRPPYSPALKRALDWFERDNHAVNLPEIWWWGYSLYGIERIGLASGFKHFGKHDWYRVLSAKAVSNQAKSGRFGDGVIDTSYALLFLSRGRHPILMNKLRFDRRDGRIAAGPAYWSNRPRDVANAARFASRQLERPINWQVVNLDHDWTDWTDSPILYIASHVPPDLTDADVENLRAFARAGGLIFTHADVAAPAFTAWAEQLARRLFPEHAMADLPADHPINNVIYRMAPPPPLRAVSNGARVLMLHSPTDLALSWQRRVDRAWESRGPAGRPPGDPARRARDLTPFQFAVNLFVYAAGKRDLRNRLDSPWVPAVAAAPAETLRVARLQHAGNWDPEPGAWARYANWLHRQTSYAVDVRTVRLSALRPADAPFAHLTGAGRADFSEAEARALKNYVEAGGIVLIDAAGGPGAFPESVRGLLARALPGNFPLVIPSDHPLLTESAPGMEDVAKPRLRPFATERPTADSGAWAMASAGKGHVIVTNLDLTSGLLGTRTWGILGYDPAYAQAFLKNALFWTRDGKPERRELQADGGK